MAAITLYQAVDPSSIGTVIDHGDVLSATETSIVHGLGPYTLNIYGVFTYEGVARGTINAIGFYLNGNTLLDISQLSISVESMLNDPAGTLANLYDGPDVVTGSASSESVLTQAGNDVARMGLGNDMAYGGGGNDSLSGESGHDNLFGEEGDDFLDGGPGNDLLDGGIGNDTYVVGDSFDSIADESGIDTVQSFIPWTLGADLENLTLLGAATLGVGNAEANVIIGNAAANI